MYVLSDISTRARSAGRRCRDAVCPVRGIEFVESVFAVEGKPEGLNQVSNGPCKGDCPAAAATCPPRDIFSQASARRRPRPDQAVGAAGGTLRPKERPHGEVAARCPCGCPPPADGHARRPIQRPPRSVPPVRQAAHGVANAAADRAGRLRPAQWFSQPEGGSARALHGGGGALL